MERFEESLQFEIYQCSVCFEAWPIKIPPKTDQFVCGRCKRDKGIPKRFSSENKMIPASVPVELQDLTQVEEMIISRAIPVMQVYLKPRFGTTSYRGHVVTLPHNVQNIANILPRCSKAKMKKIVILR